MTPEEKIVSKLSKTDNRTRETVDKVKREVCKEYGIDCPPNIKLIEAYRDMKLNDKELEALLRIRPVRSLSGVVNISILTKPFECPGECIYCPSQEGSPKSYLDNEPAVMRARLNDYDPKRQIENRLESLHMTGHPTDKIELRIVGETWSHYKKEYREEFIKDSFDALNQKESKTLKEAQAINERAKHKMVCLSIETRPDFIDKKEIEHLRKLGVTMVELGVQSIYDDVLIKNKRGHTVKSTVLATKLLKDAGFKVCYQIMPNLPGSTIEKDLAMLEIIFSDERFKPDFFKLYPCMVLKEAPLYEDYLKGKYLPYTEKEIENIIIQAKKEIFPYWVRVQRVIRDIPSQSVIAGGGSSNLRELIEKKADKEGWSCKCIRCREVGKDYDPKEKIKLFEEKYRSSGGTEIVLTFENEQRTKLFSLLRLRIPSDPYPEVLENTSIIREIHTYGEQLQIKKNKIMEKSPQHKGLGKKLIREAEKRAPTDTISVISGVGARGYWKKNGYFLKDSYMLKNI